jgi:hypothetical protein
MRYLKSLLILGVAGVAGCGSTAGNMNANLRNTTTANNNPPAANMSPAMPPPTMLPANTANANGPRQPVGRMPPGLGNEKMTPANHPPGYLGPPIKKPSP